MAIHVVIGCREGQRHCGQSRVVQRESEWRSERGLVNREWTYAKELAPARHNIGLPLSDMTWYQWSLAVDCYKRRCDKPPDDRVRVVQQESRSERRIICRRSPYRHELPLAQYTCLQGM